MKGITFSLIAGQQQTECKDDANYWETEVVIDNWLLETVTKPLISPCFSRRNAFEMETDKQFNRH